jgi:hypothetical protein
MTPNDRSLWIDLMASRYLDAIERNDFDAQHKLWRVAETNPELLAAFHDIHAGLVVEQDEVVATAIEVAAAKHLSSTEIVRPQDSRVTVADVANELFYHTPDRLPAETHALNERLRAVTESLPDDLGFSRLIAWAEERFGSAPGVYWKAFYAALVKLDLRRASESEYRLAARAAPKPEGGS